MSLNLGHQTTNDDDEEKDIEEIKKACKSSFFKSKTSDQRVT